MLAYLLLAAWLGAAVENPHRDTLFWYLEYEGSVTPELDHAAARARFEEAAKRAASCPALSKGAEARVRCLLTAIGTMTKEGASPTLGGLLVDRKGTDVGLTAAVLLLEEPSGKLEAVVFPSHVLLAVKGDATRFYDPLESGHELTQGAAFAKFGQEFLRVERANVDTFLAYYIAQFAPRGESSKGAAFVEGLFQNALKIKPRSARITFEYGTWLLGKTRYPEARDQLGESTRLNPDHADAWMNRGAALAALGKFKAARRSYVQVLRLEPNSKRAGEKIKELDAKIEAEAEAHRLD